MCSGVVVVVVVEERLPGVVNRLSCFFKGLQTDTSVYRSLAIGSSSLSYNLTCSTISESVSYKSARVPSATP